MSKITPWVGAKGIFEVKSPWELVPDTVYYCSAVVSFHTLLERKVDVLQEIYLANGLTEANYQNDLALDAYLIALKSETAATVYVPDTYIVSFPDTTLVPYSHVVVSASLGPLADALDLSFLKEQIEATIADVIGVSVTTNIHRAPADGGVTPVEHRTLETNRLSNVTVTETDRAKARKAEAEVVRLSQHVEDLERIIVSLSQQA